MIPSKSDIDMQLAFASYLLGCKQKNVSTGFETCGTFDLKVNGKTETFKVNIITNKNCLDVVQRFSGQRKYLYEVSSVREGRVNEPLTRLANYNCTMVLTYKLYGQRAITSSDNPIEYNDSDKDDFFCKLLILFNNDRFMKNFFKFIQERKASLDPNLDLKRAALKEYRSASDTGAESLDCISKSLSLTDIHMDLVFITMISMAYPHEQDTSVYIFGENRFVLQVHHLNDFDTKVEHTREQYIFNGI